MKTCFVAFLSICLLFYYEKACGKNHTNSNDSITTYHLNQTDRYFRNYDIDSAKLYLDSASFYKEKLASSLILGRLHNYYGIYYSFKQSDLEAHQNYYKAIEYFAEADKTDLLIPIYNNLAFSYIQKNDTESLKKIIEKMRIIAFQRNDSSDIINTYRITTFYYDCLYEKCRENKALLDSSIHYDSQIISIYENTENLSVRNDDIAYNYLNLASNLLEKDTLYLNAIVSYLEKSEKLMNKQDSTMLYNQYWVKGRIAYKQGKYQDAEQLFNTQLAIMDKWLQGAPLSMYAELFEMLAKVAEAQNKNEQALDYERKRINYLDRIHDAQKYEIIRELETKYEVQHKEQEIIQLTERNNFHRKLNILYICISILVFTVLFIIIHWLRQRKKVTEVKLELTHLEKHDAMLQVQLKEEQLNNTKMEKYEALLGCHFKNEQISEMDEEMKELQKECDQLNLTIMEYAEKVKKYEDRKSQQIQFATNDAYNTSLVRDIYELIKKRLTGVQEQDEYLESLIHIEDLFFAELKAKAPALSALNSKYCICFFIDMKTEYIAKCFSIEPHSVLMMRYRLKRKLQVDGDMDITMFLKQMGG